MCQEQNEQGGGTENEIKEEASVHKSEVSIYHNYNAKHSEKPHPTYM